MINSWLRELLCKCAIEIDPIGQFSLLHVVGNLHKRIIINHILEMTNDLADNTNQTFVLHLLNVDMILSTQRFHNSEGVDDDIVGVLNLLNLFNANVHGVGLVFDSTIAFTKVLDEHYRICSLDLKFDFSIRLLRFF